MFKSTVVFEIELSFGGNSESMKLCGITIGSFLSCCDNLELFRSVFALPHSLNLDFEAPIGPESCTLKFWLELPSPGKLPEVL